MQSPRSTFFLILAGLAWVNAPVVVLMIGPAFASVAIMMMPGADFPPLLAACSVGVGFALAWGWWSWTAPRWRLWAFRRATSVSQLRRRAEEIGLLWPEGHRLQGTEFRSRTYAQELHAIIEAAASAGRQ